MIRVIGRGLAGLALELATMLIVAAVILIGLSAYLTARVIGVDRKFNRTEATVKLVRDAVALAIDAKQRFTKGDGSEIACGEQFPDRPGVQCGLPLGHRGNHRAVVG